MNQRANHTVHTQAFLRMFGGLWPTGDTHDLHEVSLEASLIIRPIILFTGGRCQFAW